jgi:NADH:ubiquinone oxidoreductase subunit B-like Fe-S oxidoreductase
VQGTEQLGIPVDVHVVGCPPRPEGLLNGILKLKEKVEAKGKPHIGLPEKIIIPSNSQGLMTDLLKHAEKTVNDVNKNNPKMPVEPPQENKDNGSSTTK